MSDTIKAIVVMEARSALDAATGANPNGLTAEEILIVAMRSAKQSWITTDENLQCQSALEAAYHFLQEGDQARLVQELKGHKAVEALLAGVPVDMESFIQTRDENLAPFGITDLWKSAK